MISDQIVSGRAKDAGNCTLADARYREAVGDPGRRAKRQRRGDVVTHALSQCNFVSRRQPPYSADPTKRQRRGDVVTHALSQCNDVSRQQRPKLFPDLHKGAVDGCLGRNAQFVDDEEKLPLCQYRFEQKKFSDPCGFRRHRSDLSFQAEV